MEGSEQMVLEQEGYTEKTDASQAKKFILKEWSEEASPIQLENWSKEYPYIFAMIGQIESYLLRKQEWEKEQKEARREYCELEERESLLWEELQKVKKQKEEKKKGILELEKKKGRLNSSKEAISRGLERKMKDVGEKRSACKKWKSAYFEISHQIETENHTPLQAYGLYVEWRELLQNSVLEQTETERSLLVYLKKTLDEPKQKRKGLLKTYVYPMGWTAVKMNIPEIIETEEKEEVREEESSLVSVGVSCEIEFYQQKKLKVDYQISQLELGFYDWMKNKQDCLEKEYLSNQQRIQQLEGEVRESDYTEQEAYQCVIELQILRQKRRILKNEQAYILLLVKKGFSNLTKTETVQVLEDEKRRQEGYHDNWVVNQTEYLKNIYKTMQFTEKESD